MTDVQEVTDPMWDIFAPPKEDNSVQYFQYHVIPERTNSWANNNGLVTSGSKFYFEINDSNQWYLPSQAYIGLRCKIVNPAALNTPLTSAQLATFQNNFPLFDGARYSVNGNVVEDNSAYLQQTMLVRNLLEFSKSDDNFGDMGWDPDTGLMVGCSVSPIAANTAAGTAGNAWSYAATIPDMAGGVPDPTPYLSRAGNELAVDFSASTTAAQAVIAAGVAALVGTSSQPAVPNPQYNKGYAKRLAKTSLSQTFYIQIPLWRMFSFLNHLNTPFIGAQHQIYLQINKSGGLLIYPDGSLQGGATGIYVAGSADAVTAALVAIDPTAAPPVPATAAPATVQAALAAFLGSVRIPTAPLAALAITPNLQILNMQLWMPYVKPSPSEEARLYTKMVNGASQIIPYEHAETLFYSWPTPSSNLVWQMKTQNSHPTKVVIFFQPASWFQSNTRNGQVFDARITPLISRMWLTYAGMTFPEQSYLPSTDGMQHPYTTYKQVTQRFFDLESGPIVSYQDFNDVYPMFIFDLRFLPVSPLGGSSSDMVLNVQFTQTPALGSQAAGAVGGRPAPANNPINVFAVVFSEQEIQISALDRKILVTRKTN